MTGYRATLVVRDPGGCPVAEASVRADAPVDSVSRSSMADSASIVEEFGVRDPTVDLETNGNAEVELTPVYRTERNQVYRFTRDWVGDCVCEVVEDLGNPVSSLRAEDGELHLAIHATDLDTLSDTVGGLKSQFGGVSLRELTETGDGDSNDLVLVDRARLTDRQREIIETAHDMGYFQYPKGANAGEVAEAIGVSGSTFAEHLAAAQTKLLAAILEE